MMSLEKQLRCRKCGARGRASLEVVLRPRDWIKTPRLAPAGK